MVQILVQPPQLRKTAEQLRSQAQKIDQALHAIDDDINSLKGSVFLGHRATELQSHYAPQRDALLSAKNMVIRFAEELDTAASAFEKADGETMDKLFVHNPTDKFDIDINDVEQGLLGDCYLIAAIAAVAKQNPELLRHMIRDNGDGTYTVTFHAKNKFLGFETKGYSDKEITISLDGTEYAHIGDEIGNSQEVWVQVLEKAYAKWQGGYADIERGFPHKALEAITGIDSQDYKPSSLTIENLATHISDGDAITASSLHDYKIGKTNIPDKSDTAPLYVDNTLVTGHAYTVTAVNVENGTVTVRNPWGHNLTSRNPEVVLTFEQFQENFRGVSMNSLE